MARKLILTSDEWEALEGINNAGALGTPTSTQVRVSKRLVELGLVGKDTQGRLAVTLYGKEFLSRGRAPQVDSAYTRKKGQGRTYFYSVTWGEAEQGPWWSALVQYHDEVVGQPGGNLIGMRMDRDTAVSLVETAIEGLVGVRE